MDPQSIVLAEQLILVASLAHLGNSPKKKENVLNATRKIWSERDNKGEKNGETLTKS